MMKLNFKKISAVLGSVILTGLTFGTAAAANFPAPFVQNGVANVAVVYGTGVGVSNLDQVYAGNIKTTLGESVTTSTTASVDGESYKFEKTSTKLHLGDHYVNITSSLDEDELPTLLADGKYLDNDNDEIDYTQKITMGSLGQLTMFDDSDYAEYTPTVGFKIPSSQTLLTYEIDFSDTLDMNDMPTTDLPFMGKSYYVLSNTTTTMTLLDSAASAVLEQGETVTLDVDGNSYTVSASIFDTTNSKVKLVVNGVTTNLLGSTQTQKVGDVYVGIKEVVVQNFAGGANQVEFSIGKGKLVLTDGAGTDVQINDESVSGLVSDFDLSAAGILSKINLTWTPEDDLFITEDNAETMPGLNILTLSYGGLNYPMTETIEVKQGGDSYATLKDFPIKDSVINLDFLYGNNTYFTATGKSANDILRTDDNIDGNITFDKDTDKYFVVSWTDTRDAESYLMRASNFITESATDKFDLEYYSDGAWSVKKAAAKATDTVSIGNVELTIGVVSNSGNSVEIWKTSADTTTSITSFNTLYSKEGLTVYLPWLNTTFMDYFNDTNVTAVQACNWAQVKAIDQIGELGYAGIVQYNSSTAADSAAAEANVTCTPEATTWTLKMVEEDRSGNKYAGDTINLTMGWDSSTTQEVEVSNVTTEDVAFVEIQDTDVWRSFMYSALATEMLWDKPTSGQNSIKILYHGDEVMADAYITSPDAVITSGGAADVLVVKDTEVSSVQSKNLVIVGGSCINSAAANVLGGAYCGAAFTAATGVGQGQFLIKSVGDAYTTGQVALVVAGYDVADTNNAATYLRTKTVDTTAGKMYKGTSATEATLQVN